MLWPRFFSWAARRHHSPHHRRRAFAGTDANGDGQESLLSDTGHHLGKYRQCCQKIGHRATRAVDAGGVAVDRTDEGSGRRAVGQGSLGDVCQFIAPTQRATEPICGNRQRRFRYSLRNARAVSQTGFLRGAGQTRRGSAGDRRGTLHQPVGA